MNSLSEKFKGIPILSSISTRFMHQAAVIHHKHPFDHVTTLMKEEFRDLVSKSF